MRDRSHIATEQRNPAAAELDRLAVADAVALMQAEDATVAGAVAAERGNVVRAIELAVAAFRAGGRLIYLGAGTSGRLGVLDASECPPTFRTPPEMVVGIICGGDGALRRSVEGAEDDPDNGARAVADANVTDRDVVVGIAAGGTTPFVAGALVEARRRAARTVFLTCVPPQHADLDADVTIRPLTGPEVVAGSTRLKAATATKMVLNQITTAAMVQLGKTYGDLMVDLAATNDKLRDRGARIIAAITGLPRDQALSLLAQAGGQVKLALVMHARGVDAAEAARLLALHGGRVRGLIEPSGQR